MKYSDLNLGKLEDLVSSVEQQMVGSFYDGKSSVLRKGVLKVIASVVGAALYMLSLVVKKMWKNRFVSTCDINCLDGFGAEYSLPHKPATLANGNVIVKLASGQTGPVTIAQGTILTDELTGNEYETIEDASVNDGDTVRIAAKEVGASYNLDAGGELTLEGASEKLETTVTIDEYGLTGGKSVDVIIDGESQYWGESAEEYRSRLLYRIQNPPKGGADSDYRLWAERFVFVSRAFVFGNYPKANSVVVACANFSSGSSPALTSTQLSEVDAYINAEERRPIIADVRVISVTPAKFLMIATIAPFSTAVKESVKTAIQAYFVNLEPGSSATFAEVQNYVLANSIAKTFVINSFFKKSVRATLFSLDLSVPALVSKMSSAYAEVFSIDDGESSITFYNGETA